MSQPLFKSDRGQIDGRDIREALLKVGASECDTLYIHTGMSFGLPAIKRSQLLGELLDILERLGVDNLVFPTFTFSFCNGEAYDPDATPTPMGALNEYARKTGRGIRSTDPLLSVFVMGKNTGLAENVSGYSIGRGSSYDKLHNSGGSARFLFFGADMRDCFTYTHYAEAIMEVPYRYNRQFDGTIIQNGISHPATVWLYSTYANCRLNPVPIVHDEMERRGMLSKASLGNGSICSFTEKDGYQVLTELISRDPYCLTDGSFDINKKDTAYNMAGQRVVSVL